ncbi:MAG: hypothetical protein ACKORI_01475 [Verrucomicrobiota bacterium]
MKKLLIVGAGGFGREMHAWCRQHPDHGRVWAFEAFLDDNPEALAPFGSFAPVRPLSSHLPAADEVFVCGLGFVIEEGLEGPGAAVIRMLTAPGVHFAAEAAGPDDEEFLHG